MNLLQSIHTLLPRNCLVECRSSHESRDYHLLPIIWDEMRWDDKIGDEISRWLESYIICWTIIQVTPFRLISLTLLHEIPSFMVANENVVQKIFTVIMWQIICPTSCSINIIHHIIILSRKWLNSEVTLSNILPCCNELVHLDLESATHPISFDTLCYIIRISHHSDIIWYDLTFGSISIRYFLRHIVFHHMNRIQYRCNVIECHGFAS